MYALRVRYFCLFCLIVALYGYFTFLILYFGLDLFCGAFDFVILLQEIRY